MSFLYLSPKLILVASVLIASQLLFMPPTHAQTGFSLEREAVIRDLNWLNNNFLGQQRERYIELFTNQFGKRPSKSRGDLYFLQRLFDNKILRKQDTLELQALGVLLGDMLLKERGKLSWMVYEDDLGKSHALCAPKEKYCLFPITMLSRRYERNVIPDVSKVYESALKDIDEGLEQEVRR